MAVRRVRRRVEDRRPPPGSRPPSGMSFEERDLRREVLTCVKARRAGFADTGGMSTVALVLPGRLPVTETPAVVRPVASVFLPKEHGSWSLALEPLALGLLVAPSWAGGALAVAAVAGFFARRPLKASFDAVPSARRLASREALVMWMALAVAAMFEVLVLAPAPALWPLAPAAALGGIFAWFDAQGDSRAAGAEVAGSAAFALVPAAIATLAGWPVAAALALAGVALMRNVPAVLTVRGYLRLAKGGSVNRPVAVLAGAAGGAVSVTLVAFGLVPAAAGLFGAVLFVRVLWLLGPWRPAWPARRVGMFEALLGVAGVAAIAAGYRA